MVCDLLDETSVDATKNSPRCQDLYRANDLCSWRFESLILCFYQYFTRETNIASSGLRGAMVARLTPDQKAACSSHVGVKFFPFTFDFQGIIYAAYGTKQSTCLISSHFSFNLLQYSHFVLFQKTSEMFAV